jgi:hypothetical protein
LTEIEGETRKCQAFTKKLSSADLFGTASFWGGGGGVGNSAGRVRQNNMHRNRAQPPVMDWNGDDGSYDEVATVAGGIAAVTRVVPHPVVKGVSKGAAIVTAGAIAAGRYAN